MVEQPNLYIIAGCNGAGKTTASFVILPELLGCREFINADEIAKGISPFNPESVAISAGKIMLERINQLIEEQIDFGFETTLSSLGVSDVIVKARSFNYKITLIFFWLDSVDLAIQRVMQRVKDGGHNIPEETIIRRYKRGKNHFKELYKTKVDVWMLVDNSNLNYEVIAETKSGQQFVYNINKFNLFNL